LTIELLYYIENFVHFVLSDYVNGGELFTHLNQREHFTEAEVRIYIGEIVLALETLHKVSLYMSTLPISLLILILNTVGSFPHILHISLYSNSMCLILFLLKYCTKFSTDLTMHLILIVINEGDNSFFKFWVRIFKETKVIKI